MLIDTWEVILRTREQYSAIAVRPSLGWQGHLPQKMNEQRGPRNTYSSCVLSIKGYLLGYSHTPTVSSSLLPRLGHLETLRTPHRCCKAPQDHWRYPMVPDFQPINHVLLREEYPSKINHLRASSPFAPCCVGVMQDKGYPNFIERICTTPLTPPVTRWHDMYSIYTFF